MVRASARCASTGIAQKDAFFFNWSIAMPQDFQRPFDPTHEAMAALDLHHGRKPHELAANLRRAFSGIVAGNVKEEGMRRIEEHGPSRSTATRTSCIRWMRCCAHSSSSAG